MSAFNDYCIVCEKLCSSNSVYCSDDCKEKDVGSHFEFNNVPQLISPALQPRSDSIASTLTYSQSASHIETENEDSEEDHQKHQEYLIKSPLLLSSTIKDQSIAGLNLNESDIPRAKIGLDEHHAQLLSASSNNYKKWLNVVL